MSDLSGKKGLILGVGNQRSIAWAMAEQLQQQGAELGLTFLSDPKGRFEANVRKLGDKVGATFIHECDVSIDESIQQMSDALKGKCCLLYTSPSPRDTEVSRMPSSA